MILSFSISLFFSLHPTAAHHQQPFIVISLSLFALATHLSWREFTPTWTLTAPSTCQHPPLVSEPRATFLCLPLFPVTVCPPPLLSLSYNQVCIIPWGVFPSRVTMSTLFPRLAIPEFSSGSLHLLVLGLLWGGFCAREGGQGASTHWNSLSTNLSPPATCPLQRCSG